MQLRHRPVGGDGDKAQECHLVTGGGGYVGQRLGRALHELGHRVVLFDIREPLEALPAGLGFRKGDIRNHEEVKVALAGVDCVYHMASYGMSGREQGFRYLTAENVRMKLAHGFRYLTVENVRMKLHAPTSCFWIQVFDCRECQDEAIAHGFRYLTVENVRMKLHAPTSCFCVTQSSLPALWDTRCYSRGARRPRTNFSESAVQLLKVVFELTQYPDIDLREKLADDIGLPEATIRMWFSNRRTRIRRAARKSLSDSNSCTIQSKPHNEPIPAAPPSDSSPYPVVTDSDVEEMCVIDTELQSEDEDSDRTGSDDSGCLSMLLADSTLLVGDAECCEPLLSAAPEIHSWGTESTQELSSQPSTSTLSDSSNCSTHLLSGWAPTSPSYSGQFSFHPAFFEPPQLPGSHLRDVFSPLTNLLMPPACLTPELASPSLYSVAHSIPDSLMFRCPPVPRLATRTQQDSLATSPAPPVMTLSSDLDSCEPLDLCVRSRCEAES